MVKIKNLSYEELMRLEKSQNLLDLVRLINVYSLISITCFGLIGNSIVVAVFSQKRTRSNASHVFMPASACVNNLFLITHFFEDTLRTIKDIYLIKNNYVVDALTLLDKNIILCKLANFLRYSLRFISAYLILAITIQRLLVVYHPLKTRFKEKRFARRLIGLIVLIGLALNSVVPFLFSIDVKVSNESDMYCDVNKEIKSEYFLFNLVYSFIIVIIPSIVIFVSNCLIIYKTNKQNNRRKTLNITSRFKQTCSLKIKNSSDTNLLPMKSMGHSSLKFESSFSCDGLKKMSSFKKQVMQKDKSFETPRSNPNYKLRSLLIEMNQQKADSLITQTRIKPHYFTREQLIMKNTKKHSKKRSTTMLLVISFSFVSLNAPYFISWLLFFYDSAFFQNDKVNTNNLFSVLQITEIFFVLNYAVLFIILLATGSLFKSQLKTFGSLSARLNSNHVQLSYYVETYRPKSPE